MIELYQSLKPGLIESIVLLKKSQRDSPELSTVVDTNHSGTSEEKGFKGERKKVWIEAYGCSASMADYEMIAGLLKSYGYKLAKHESESSVNLVVTCSVKDVTEHKMISRITKLSKSPKPLIVAGCLPKADQKKVEFINPTASLLGPHSINRTIEVVNSAIRGVRTIALEDSVADKINMPRSRLNPITSIVEIASGCMSKCSFCQTKLAKGMVRSYRTGDIIRQIRTDIDQGCKEIWLTSTDNGCYGRDIGTDLVGLLDACCQIEAEYKIRVGMMNPMYIPKMLDKLVKLYKHNSKIYKFLHIPVQSGCDRILKKMKRGHTAEIFTETVKIFRKNIPEITIATDIIVGFPTETQKDFQQTMDLIRHTQPDIVNISKYSSRPGTAAAQLKKINSEIVKGRSMQLHLLSEQISKMRNLLWKGWRGEMLIHKNNNKIFQGRNYAYKPIHIPLAYQFSSSSSSSSDLHVGMKANIEIIGFNNRALIGRVINLEDDSSIFLHK